MLFDRRPNAKAMNGSKRFDLASRGDNHRGTNVICAMQIDTGVGRFYRSGCALVVSMLNSYNFCYGMHFAASLTPSLAERKCGVFDPSNEETWG